MKESNFEPDFDINLDFYIDSEGYPKVTIAPEYSLLGHYLESEIQGIPMLCQELLEAIAEVERGDRAEIQGVGNGYGLAINNAQDNSQVTIWSEFTEPQHFLEIPLDLFRRSLQLYRNFLEKHFDSH